MLEEALKYEALGFSVIPVHVIRADGLCSCGSARCKSPGKHPRITWRANQTTRLTADELRECFSEKSPPSSVGIVTGPISGIMVLDIDGPEGLASLKKAGFPYEDLPKTPTVKTGGGGMHLYYRYPEGDPVKTATGILHKVDIRAQGGFVVAPPSIHKSGRKYEWMKKRSLGDLEIAEFDITQLLGTRQVPKKIRISRNWYDELINGAPEGERNSSATRLAGRYLSRGLTTDETSLILIAWNQRNDPPLPEAEIEQIVRSVDKAETQTGFGLEWISGVLGVNVVAIRRITGDEPKCIMEFDEGSCSMTTAELLSPVAFQSSIADATKFIVPKRSAKTSPSHEKVIQAILRESTDEDAGHEATITGEMRSLIGDYILSQRVMPEVTDQAPMSGPFMAEGKIWIAILDIVQRSNTRWGVKSQNSTTMAQRMRSIGMEPKSFRVADGSIRSVWGISEKEVKHD
jgi:hypothetical protein